MRKEADVDEAVSTGSFPGEWLASGAKVNLQKKTEDENRVAFTCNFCPLTSPLQTHVPSLLEVSTGPIMP